MKIDLITIFPEYFSALNFSLLGAAQDQNLVEIEVHDLRDFTEDVHRTVDDTPYGGGPGMVMKVDVIAKAVDAILPKTHLDEVEILITSAAGRLYKQNDAKALAQKSRLIVVCGRFEGVDQRVIEYYRSKKVAIEEITVGDYVTFGGEAPALIIVESVVRLLPQVIGNSESLDQESFADPKLVEYPQYTRPAEFAGLKVPQILLEGNHQAIADYRQAEAERKTQANRPDLLTDNLK